MGIRHLEHRIKSFQDFPMPVLQQYPVATDSHFFPRVQHIQYRFVIIVHQDHATATCLFVCPSQHFRKTAADIRVIPRPPVNLLPLAHLPVQHILQNTRFFHPAIEINMEHRINEPILLQALNGQSFEQFLPSEEIVLQGGNQQALSKAPGTAQKINLTLFHERIDQIRLVDINVTVLDDLFETLNAYRIFHDQAIFYVLTDKDIKTFRQGNAMDSPASIRTTPASVTPL